MLEIQPHKYSLKKCGLQCTGFKIQARKTPVRKIRASDYRLEIYKLGGYTGPKDTGFKTQTRGIGVTTYLKKASDFHNS